MVKVPIFDGIKNIILIVLQTEKVFLRYYTFTIISDFLKYLKDSK